MSFEQWGIIMLSMLSIPFEQWGISLLAYNAHHTLLAFWWVKDQFTSMHALMAIEQWGYNADQHALMAIEQWGYDTDEHALMAIVVRDKLIVTILTTIM